jgi:hypothetical protein
VPGFWDDDEVRKAAAGGEYASLREVGDTVDGKVSRLRKRTFNEGKSDERTAIEIEFEDGPTLTAGQVLLMRGLYELQPVPGDELSIVLADIERRAGKTLKRFRIAVTRADGAVATVDQTL